MLSTARRVIRAWLAGFTTSACCLLAAGITAALSGLLLGESGLIRAGSLAIAIPVVAGVVVRRSQVSIASRRSAEPTRAMAGTPITISLTVTNRSMLPTGALMMEDGLPSQLAGRARFVLDGLGRRESRSISYRIPGLDRGRYTVGPLRLRLSDPFGMVDVTRSFTATSTFVLTPEIHPLPGPMLPRSWDSGENAGSHSIGNRGADDASTREYRRGDDLRKIHWRSSARIGSLMVRHEERPWQGHTAVLLDTRAIAHDSRPTRTPGVDATEQSSLEWAISCTGSIGANLLSNGREVNLVAGAGGARYTGADAFHLLDARASMQASPERDLSTLLDPLRDAGREVTLVAVLGRMDPASLHILSRIHPRGASVAAFAVLLDTSAWRGDSATDTSWATGAAALRASGWWVARAGPTDSIPDVWSALVSQRPDNSMSPAGR
jgi:uncharacterized protein (DUF58 family)